MSEEVKVPEAVTIEAPKKTKKSASKVVEPSGPQTVKAGEKFAKALSFKRNDLGLVESINYSFDETGSVDWSKTIPKEFFAPNASWFKERKKEVPASIKDLEDSQLIILLAGLKWAAKIRGFSSVDFESAQVSDGCVTKCTISWIKNYESEASRYSEIASSNSKNCTDSLSNKYMEAISANRAFARCVRNFLNINTVSDVEMDKGSSGEQTKAEAQQQTLPAKTDPTSIFIKMAKEAGYKDAKSIKAWIDSTNVESVKSLLIESEADFQKLKPKEIKLLIANLKKDTSSPPQTEG